MIKRLLLYSVILYFSPQFLMAQEGLVHEQEYEVLKEKLGYDNTKKGLRLREKYIEQLLEDRPEEKQQFGVGTGIVQQIAYALVFVLVGLILYMIFSKVQIDKKVDHEAIDLGEIEDLEDIDAAALYKAAVSDGNYRLAIRMHFILCLQQLSKKGEITWENEKTNRDYYREIGKSDIKRSFRAVANVFERCWYADMTLELDDFKRYDKKFIDFLNLLK